MHKILVCSNTAWYLWNFRLSLMETLRDEGYEVVACAPHDDYVDKITAAGIRFIPVSIDRRGTNPFTETLLIARYCRIISAEHPDIILSYTPKPNIYATLAARIFRVPVINNIAGLGFVFIQGGVKAAIVRRLYKIALSGSRRVFFQNRDDMREFVDGGLVASVKASLLPGSGVDTEKFSPRPPSSQKEGFTFLLISRMLWDKGVGEFVEAAKQLHSKYNFRCINSESTIQQPQFYLQGPTDPGNPAAIPKDTLEEWTKNGIVTWLGNSDDVRGEISNADCIVLPSYYREGIPKCLLEAASMAKPIITTDEPGCREAVVDGVTGFLCRSRDALDLEDKMDAMMMLTPEMRSSMGSYGRERMVSFFEEKIIITRYQEEISNIII